MQCENERPGVFFIMLARSIDAIRRVGNSLALYAEWIGLECRAALAIVKSRDKPGNRHMVLLVDQFPPSESGGVYRPASFARYGDESGWRVTVLVSRSAAKSGALGKALRRQIPAHIEVRGLGVIEPALSWKIAPHVDGGLSSAIELVHKSLPYVTEGVDAIVASGPPFYIFVAALFLKRLTGVRLVLDYRDEWSECPFDFVTVGKLDRWWERRCLRASDSAVFTTTSMLEHSLRRFPRASPRQVVIPNGFDFAMLDNKTASQPEPNAVTPNAARITFVGNLSSHNDPASFLGTLESVLYRRPDLISHLEFCWIGPRSELAEQQLSRFPYAATFRIVPAIPPSAAMQWMESSTMVLLIASTLGWSRYRQGKMYSYLASRAPILAYAVTGEMADVITELDAGTIVGESDDCALEAALDTAVRQPDHHPHNPKRETWIRKHDRRLLARQLFAHLDQLVTETPGG